MILKNFVTPFVYARGLKNLGYKQENHLFYYHNKTKELYPAISLITGAPDFSKRFTAAPTDADLNSEVELKSRMLISLLTMENINIKL